MSLFKLIVALAVLLLSISCKEMPNSKVNTDEYYHIEFRVWKPNIAMLINYLSKIDELDDLEIIHISEQDVVKVSSKKKNKKDAKYDLEVAEAIIIAWGKKEENQAELYFDNGKDLKGNFKYQKILKDSVMKINK